MQELQDLHAQAFDKIKSADSLAALDAVRVEYLGKKGQLTALLKNVSSLPASERPEAGKMVNLAKRELSELIGKKHDALAHAALEEKLRSEAVDVTLPARGEAKGSLHPVTKVRTRICQYFKKMGFEIVEGPEIETDHYNFEALNIPSHHPARAMHDTFYFGDGNLLRTHTSPVQIREMEDGEPPFRLIAPGRVYRCDSDMTHTPMFHQVEGLYIAKDASFAGLKSLLKDFFAYFFEKELELRFRASYFPFTEPSAEVDVACTQCDGKGCRSCKFTGWLEILGCGMVHPNVLKAVNIDPAEYNGWAFGIGIDRLAMLRYKIDDLRVMFESDLRFLSQF